MINKFLAQNLVIVQTKFEKLWKMFWFEVKNLEYKDFATAENAQCAEKT